MKVTPGKDGTLEKLPARAQLENALMAIGFPMVMLACAQWLINTYRANKRGRFEWPVTISIYNYLVGESCAGIVDRLNQYGISTQLLWLQFSLWPGGQGIGLDFVFWVPRSQAAMADDILRQYASAYAVTSPPLGRGYTYGKPWGVGAKARSWDEAIVKWMFSMISERSSVAVGKSERPQRLPQADKRRATVGNRRRVTKPVSVWKKVGKALW